MKRVKVNNKYIPYSVSMTDEDVLICIGCDVKEVRLEKDNNFSETFYARYLNKAKD